MPPSVKQFAIRIEGLKEFEKALRRLGDREARKIVRASTHRAMLPAVKQAKANVPVETGALQRALIRKTVVYPSGTVITHIGANVRVKATNPAQVEVRRPYKYLHLVEFGTRHSAPSRFLERAFRSTEGQVLGAHKRILREKLTKAAKS